MKLSSDTESVLGYLDQAVEGGLRKRSDIGVLLELGATYNQPDLFNQLVTSGTAVWKVHKTLRRVRPGDQGHKLLEEEFGRQLNAMREHMASLVTNAPDHVLDRFDEIYFGLTQGVIKNLVDLGHDFDALKSLRELR